MLPDTVMACEKCFSVAGASLTVDGIRLAMLGLVVLTGIVWSGIGMFFINMRRRARQLEMGTHVVNEQGELILFPEQNLN